MMSMRPPQAYKTGNRDEPVDGDGPGKIHANKGLMQYLSAYHSGSSSSPSNDAASDDQNPEADEAAADVVLPAKRTAKES